MIDNQLVIVIRCYQRYSTPFITVAWAITVEVNHDFSPSIHQKLGPSRVSVATSFKAWSSDEGQITALPCAAVLAKLEYDRRA